MQLPAYETLLIQQEAGVTKVTLNRPAKKNAMNPTMHREIDDALDRLAHDPETRVLVLTGAGDSFCAGMDLKEFYHDLVGTSQAREIEDIAVRWRAYRLRLFPRPTIAAVNGWCFAGGVSIVGVCDLAIAAEEAVFGLAEINFGLFPGGVVGKSFADLLLPRNASYYALTGEPFDGRRAAEIGLVNYATPLARLEEETRSVASKLLDKDPEALRLAKEFMRLAPTMRYEEAMAYSLAAEVGLTLSKESRLRTSLGEFVRGGYRPGLGSQRAQPRRTRG